MNVTFKHNDDTTPGPWHYNDTWALVKHGQTEICALHSNHQNGHLIAAAPDLLAALERTLGRLEVALDRYGDLNWTADNEAINQAEAAIKRAKGAD